MQAHSELDGLAGRARGRDDDDTTRERLRCSVGFAVGREIAVLSYAHTARYRGYTFEANGHRFTTVTQATSPLWDELFPDRTMSASEEIGDRAEWIDIGTFATGLDADIARDVLERAEIPVFVQSNAAGIFGP